MEGIGERLYNASAGEMYPLLMALRSMPEVRNCYTFGATLHVVAGDGFDAARITADLQRQGLTDVRISPARGNIEDLFIKLAGNE